AKCAKRCSRCSVKSSGRNGSRQAAAWCRAGRTSWTNTWRGLLGAGDTGRASSIRPEVREEIAFIKTQSGRAREIIRNLSRFSSQQTGPTELVDLRDVVKEVVQLRRRDLDASEISLEVTMSTQRKVYTNFTEVEQVMLNFVINAQQSIEGSGRNRGRILIMLFYTGKKVRFEAHACAPGVMPEDEQKLFQPFFTTKPVGKGTGLGLSVSYGIIESYGGTSRHPANEWGGATIVFVTLR